MTPRYLGGFQAPPSIVVAGVLAVQQFFASTADRNDEIVITLMRRLAGCDASSARTALAELRTLVIVGGDL